MKIYSPKIAPKIALVALLSVALCLGATQDTFAQKNKKGKDSEKNNGSKDAAKINQLLFDAIGKEMKNDTEGAISAYKLVLQTDPKNDAAMFALAKIYFEAQNAEQTLLYAEQAVTIDSKNKWYLAQYAEALAASDKFKEAAEAYRKLVAQNPNDYEYAFDWAYMRIKSNDVEGAIAVYDQVEKSVGVSEEMTVQKQKLYMKLGKIDKAIAELQKLVDSDPQEPRYYQLLAEMYQANNMNDKAMEVLEKMMTVSPDNPYGNLALAEYYHQKGNDGQYFDMIKKAFINPSLPINLKAQLISGYIDRKDASPQIAELIQIITDTHPKESLSYVLSGDYLYAVQGKKQESLNQFRKAAQIDGNRYEVWERIMEIEIDLADFQNLLKDSQTISELFPNEPIPFFYNGLANNRLNKHEAAVKSLKKAAMMAVGKKDFLVQIYTLMGDSYNEIQEYTKSDESYEKALALNPNSATVLNNYAYFLSLRNDKLDKASEMAAKANQIEPNQSSYQDTYAWILYAQKKYTDARLWIEKAITNGGAKSGTILEHYGDILYQLNETDKAVEQWQKAKTLGDTSDKIDAKIKNKKL